MTVKEKLHYPEKATPLSESVEFTADWPIKELKKELLLRESSKDSTVSSVNEFYLWCERNPS